ncbi:GNAT family N-acetyltransferase [Nonomuraea sp. M3C6]|uniref:GNAT family N-acetyltransferase n=1 Tax=Nonomuraea marmarensis TaxID=3351344 RepID=A0ABW7AGM5_9ACTN
MMGHSGGVSETGLRRLREGLARYVDFGKIPGLVALVGRGGQTHVEAIGTMRHDGGAPMLRDTIFRMASTSKPVTMAAAMVLLDECRLRLDDPVDEWLPELADRGDLLLTVAALHGNVMAGFTEILIRAGEQRRALQYDTAVVPKHRGHGLGRWLKAAMVGRLRAEQPGHHRDRDGQRPGQRPHAPVNQHLGFREHRRSHEYQLDVQAGMR